MKIMFEIEMDEFTRPNDFFNFEIDESGKISEVCDGHFNIEVAPTPYLNFNTDCNVLKFFVEVVTTVGTGLLVNWLWELIKDKKEIRINKRKYEIKTKEELTDSIKENLSDN